jgi:TusA-related sulfurtransferase
MPEEETMAITVDTRGLSCPQPVLMTLAAIKKCADNELIVQTDNEASRENVSRAANKSGWQLESENEDAGTYTLVFKKQ